MFFRKRNNDGERKVDVAIIGAGHAGLNAIKEIRKVTENFVLINGGGLGTTCARMGCMPSKVALEVAQTFDARKDYAKFGISGGAEIDIDHGAALDYVRDMRDVFVDLVLANTTDEMADELIEGYAEFVDPNRIKVGETLVHARSTIIATGAQSTVPAAWKLFGDSILTVEGLFELESLPESVAVIGAGPIGLEIGQTLHKLGVRVSCFDKQSRVCHIQDPEINRAAIDVLGRDFPIFTGEAVSLERKGPKMLVRAGSQEMLVDKVFAALGRAPNLSRLRIDRLGARLDARGNPVFDPATMQVEGLPVFVAGDATGRPGGLQVAAEDGKIAGYNAVRDRVTAFRRKTPMSIVFTEPNIVAVGKRWGELDVTRTTVGQLRLGPVGRAMISGRNRGMIRLYADKASGMVLGGAMIGTRCEHLAHLLAWAVEKRMTVKEMLNMPYYHPVIEEALQDVLTDMAKRDGLEDLLPYGLEPIGEPVSQGADQPTGARELDAGPWAAALSQG